MEIREQTKQDKYSKARRVAQSVKSLPTVRETWVQYLGQEDPLKKEIATHFSTLFWRIPSVHGVTNG